MGNLAMETSTPPRDAAPASAINLADVRKRILANRRSLGTRYFERADVLAALDTALGCEEHVLLVGDPGTGKSALARAWASQFAGTYREDLFTRQSTEADHLAYLDVQAFTQGQYVCKTDGKITEAHIAFADETFKANGGFLNSLLGWLNERNVRGGHKSPLITCIGASNEFGEDDSVAALEDRLLFRFWVEPMKDRANRLAFLRAQHTNVAPPPLATITIPEVKAMQVAIQALPLDPLVEDALLDIQDALRGAGIKLSDRRIGKCIRILQSFAWLDGSQSVEIDHIDCLRNVLWVRPEDRPTVETALGAINRGMIGEIRTIVERTLDLYQQAKAQPNFRDQALAVAAQIESSGRDIRDRFGGKVPDRVKVRAKGYLDELREAYEACKKAADGLRV